MNFLSHYHVSAGYQNLTRVACLFPDVFPKFSYLHNKHIVHTDKRLFTDLDLQILKGIDIHYEDDTTFHGAPYFAEHTGWIEAQMNQTETLKGLQRKFFVSHILYELILDHWILTDHLHYPEEIYEILRSTDISVLHDFWSKILGNSDQISLLLDSYESFLSRKFLFFYTEEANLVKALHKVTGKIAHWDHNEETESAFIYIIQSMKSRLPFPSIFDHVIASRA